MRLIDANELKKAMWEAKGHYPAFSDVTLQSIYKVIDNAPTVAESIVIDKINADTGEITYHRADMSGKE